MRRAIVTTVVLAMMMIMRAALAGPRVRRPTLPARRWLVGSDLVGVRSWILGVSPLRGSTLIAHKSGG